MTLLTPATPATFSATSLHPLPRTSRSNLSDPGSLDAAVMADKVPLLRVALSWSATSRVEYPRAELNLTSLPMQPTGAALLDASRGITLHRDAIVRISSSNAPWDCKEFEATA